MIPALNQRYAQKGIEHIIGTIVEITGAFTYLNIFDHKENKPYWNGKSSDLRPGSNDNGCWRHLFGQEKE